MKKKDKQIKIDFGEEQEILKQLHNFFKNEMSLSMICEKVLCPDCKEQTFFAKIEKNLYICPCEKYFDAKTNGSLIFEQSKLKTEELEQKLEDFKKGPQVH